jgi:hypothetical protein
MKASKVWVKGIFAYAEGVVDVKVNMRDLSGQAEASLLRDVQCVPDLGRRAGCDEHRHFSVFKARDAGHCSCSRILLTISKCTTLVVAVFKSPSDAIVD